MNDFRFSALAMLHLLWLLPAVVAVFIYAAQRRRHALRTFADAGILQHLGISSSAARRRWKAALVVAGLGTLIIGLSRPGWNPEPKLIQRQGRDVVFVLDVSKSMLADDLAPNRLDRAKLDIRDCLEVLEGDRVALVAFAGTAAVKCPLTLDYGFFRMMLDDIGTDSIDRGGTMIGDALRRTMDEVFDDRERKFKDIVLITDGEDHESFPIEAATEAGERGIRLIAVGLGDPDEGRRIPVTDALGNRTFLTYNGREVWSRLDADTLLKMVNATPGGRYLPVATGTIDLARTYRELIATAEKREVESQTVKRYEEKFQIFLGLTFVLLLADITVKERKR